LRDISPNVSSGTGQGLILKKYALFRQHREASEAIGTLLTIQRGINPTEISRQGQDL